MDRQIDSLVSDVQKLVPFTERSEIEYLVSQMSQRSGIGMANLLTSLYDDLQSGIPFRYTAVGKSKSMSQW